MVLLNHNYWRKDNDEEERHRFIVIVKVMFSEGMRGSC